MSEAPTIRELQKQVFDFAEKTFGPGREDAAWKKLFEELGETLKSPRDPNEWGDVFILLFDLATIYGVQVDEATLGKLELIRNRVWARTETGTFQHVPGAEKPVGVTYTHVCEGGPCSGLTFTTSDHMDAMWVPDGHTGPGAYMLERKDRGMDKVDRYIHKWDTGVEMP